MKLCIVTPNSEYSSQAGPRIRYERIRFFLAKYGYETIVETISSLSSIKRLDADVYLFSKCYDARAIVIAKLLKGIKVVGIDIFDDYFSQTMDPRFFRLRYWLSEMLACSDFALSSTLIMKKVIHQYDADIPVHVLNDPVAEEPDDQWLINSIRNRTEKTITSHKIQLAWFGIGDNPNFPVGLQDLVAYSPVIGKLHHAGYQISLNILTNARALTDEALLQLRKLPVEYQIELWTEQKEIELLKKSLVCFLPVNCQNFSIAKSLNRCITALSHGCQVISAGYPLYKPLGQFIYRDSQTFLDDLAKRQFKLDTNSIASYREYIEANANPETEALKLAKFVNLIKIGGAGNYHSSQAIIIHGIESVVQVHKYVQKLGGVSVALPGMTKKLNYDLRFQLNRKNCCIDILIQEKWLANLPQEISAKTVAFGRVLDRFFYRLPAPFKKAEQGFIYHLIEGSRESVFSCYPYLIDYAQKTLHFLYPQGVITVSESAKNIWWPKNIQKDNLLGPGN